MRRDRDGVVEVGESRNNFRITTEPGHYVLLEHEARVDI
jgi:hypothetical protein